MPKDYRHRCRRSIRLTYGINWPRVGEGSVTERRVPKGVPVAAHRAGMYANHARREAEHGAMMLDEVRVVPAHQRTDYRELVRVSAGREAENWVRAVVWLLRLLSPDGWQGPILERNALKRARVEVAVQKARKLTLRRLGLVCPKCKKNSPTDESHSCPYASEVNNNHSDEHCRCCEDCIRECAHDV